MDHFSITSTTKHYPTEYPYAAIKNSILGKNYELSLVFIGEKRARRLNQENRQKDYIPNVLSFPLDRSVGEVYICPEVARKEASKFNLSVPGYVAYLFIHGLLHLKGYDHSDTMQKLERKYCKTFSVS